MLILTIIASFTAFTLFIWIFEPMIYEPLPPALIVSAGVFMLGFSIAWSAYKGYTGEREVGRELSKLPDDYAVFFNVPLEGLDADVVVVGPTGVYVLEVKNWSNCVLTPRKERWIRIPKRWMFYGQAYEVSSPTRQAVKAATRVRSLVKTWVEAIAVFPRSAKCPVREYESVKILYFDEIASYILSKPPKLSAKKIHELEKILRDYASAV